MNKIQSEQLFNCVDNLQNMLDQMEGIAFNANHIEELQDEVRYLERRIHYFETLLDELGIADVNYSVADIAAMKKAIQDALKLPF